MSLVDEPVPTPAPRRLTGPLPPIETGLKLGDLIVPGPSLHATDSVGRALRAFATGAQSILPVVEGETLVGVLAERDVLDWAADRAGRLAPLEPAAAREAMVMQIMRADVAVGYVHDPLEAVLPHFERSGVEAVPVLDALDRFVGMLPRALALEALTHSLRPERVGGMATPFGLFLTTGHQRAGVGDGALFATGLAVVALNVALNAGLHQAARLAHLRPDPTAMAIALLAAFLVLLRSSRLSGLHAAEHQVVNAIERGEALDPKVVAAMPREHARCGTNLLALLFGVQLLIPLIGRDPLWLLPAAALLFFGWRRVGGFLQRWFTTRTATAMQLRAAVRTGEALIGAYAERPAYRAGRWRRTWNMGVVQVLAGAFVGMTALTFAQRELPSLKGVFF